MDVPNHNSSKSQCAICPLYGYLWQSLTPCLSTVTCTITSWSYGETIPAISRNKIPAWLPLNSEGIITWSKAYLNKREGQKQQSRGSDAPHRSPHWNTNLYLCLSLYLSAGHAPSINLRCTFFWPLDTQPTSAVLASRLSLELSLSFKSILLLSKTHFPYQSYLEVVGLKTGKSLN